MSDTERESLGRIVREAWVQYCKETGDSKTSHIVPWEGISEWDKEADRRIGEAVYVAATAASEATVRRAVEATRDAAIRCGEQTSNAHISTSEWQTAIRFAAIEIIGKIERIDVAAIVARVMQEAKGQ